MAGGTHTRRPARTFEQIREQDGGGGPSLKGLFCPKCGGQQFKTPSTFAVSAGIRRLRKCVHCGHEWHTTER